jgi:type II secretory pathway pseudopilin PulG
MIMSLLAILLPVLLVGFTSSINGKAQQEQRLKATALLKQAEEAVRTVRESGWNNIPANGNYYAQSNGTTWQLISGTALINDLSEQISIESAYRNNGILVDQGTPGAVVDPSTRIFDIQISWITPFPSSINSKLYLVRLENESLTFTDHPDFDPGEVSGTDIVDTTGTPIPQNAQIQLAAGGGGGDWCDPSLSITEVDLPKSGVANAISAIEGNVFAGTGENSSGVSFAKVSFTIDQDPPVVTPTPYPTFDGYKTNAVFGESNYAYLATDNNSKEVVIIDLNNYSDPPTNLKFQEVGSINLKGNLNATSVFVTNNKAYITTSNNKLYIYDVSNHSAPNRLNEENGFTLDGEGKKVLVTGNYAYIATNSTTYQFEIVDISTASSPSWAGKLNINTGQSGIDVYVNTAISSPDKAYLATNYVAGQSNFYVVDISNISSPTINGQGRYDTQGMSPTGITVVTGNIGIIVGSGGSNQYQVVLLDTMASCGGLQYASGIRGVSSVLQANGYAYSYIITGDASAELKIILGGGQGGGTFASSGTYTSSVFDAGFSTAFNRFSGNAYVPSANTVLEMQVAVSNTDTSCTTGNFTYIGPDPDNPTGSRYILSNGTFNGIIPYKSVNPYYNNPGRYFCYKLFFNTTDTNQSPIFHDLSINYSP